MFHLHDLILDPDISEHICRNTPNPVRCQPCFPGWQSSLKGVPMLVEPCAENQARVGRAFRYRLWLEVQRRYAEVRPPYWVADEARAILRDPFMSEPLADRTGRILHRARRAAHHYVSRTRTTRPPQELLATLAYKLARLDLISCHGLLDPHLDEVDPPAITELQALLSVVPFDVLIQGKPILLGPPLGQFQDIVCGADLITGDWLINFVTSKEQRIKSRDSKLLVASFVLARDQRRHEPAFPVVNNLGLYFSRLGHLVHFNKDEWMSSPSYVPFEQGLLEQIQQARVTGSLRTTSTWSAQLVHAAQGQFSC